MHTKLSKVSSETLNHVFI